MSEKDTKDGWYYEVLLHWVTYEVIVKLMTGLEFCLGWNIWEFCLLALGFCGYLILFSNYAWLYSDIVGYKIIYGILLYTISRLCSPC